LRQSVGISSLDCWATDPQNLAHTKEIPPMVNSFTRTFPQHHFLEELHQ